MLTLHFPTRNKNADQEFANRRDFSFFFGAGDDGLVRRNIAPARRYDIHT
jgi:hypothetical protein